MSAKSIQFANPPAIVLSVKLPGLRRPVLRITDYRGHPPLSWLRGLETAIHLCHIPYQCPYVILETDQFDGEG